MKLLHMRTSSSQQSTAQGSQPSAQLTQDGSVIDAVQSAVPVTPELITAFKAAMRRLTGGVALLTTTDGISRSGMAVTAVCSLGIDPPTLIVSIAHTASMHGPTLASGRIAVNLLREAHSDMVADFSGRKKGEERFQIGEWIADRHGLPILADAQASLSCRVVQRTEYSGHSVLFIAVEEIRVWDAIEPLLYQNGGVAGARSLVAQ